MSNFASTREFNWWMGDLTDMDLVREYATRNSQPAFAELVQRHINLVYSVALRFVGNSQDAQDVTQAVFITLARKALGLPEKTVIAGWLYETTRLTAMQFLRSKSRRQSREQEAHMLSTLNASETEDVWQQIAPLLEDAMTRLSEKERTLLALHFFENKTGAEAAAALGIEEWAARKRLTRAVEKMRKFFLRRGIGISTGVLMVTISANSTQAAPAALVASISSIALTKGADASASISTLVEGALKAMAWSKAKTIVTSVGLVVAITFSALILYKRHYAHGDMHLPIGNVVPEIDFGRRCGFVLASNGSLWSWGEESFESPSLGLGNIRNTPVLRRIGSDTDWINISCGPYHNLALKRDGTVWSWGQNKHYQLGDGTQTNRSRPVRSLPGNDWKDIAAGGYHSLALKKDGTLWAWGQNWGGQLGLGTFETVPLPVQVGPDAGWTRIWAGGPQSVGQRSDGSLWFWGSLDGAGTGPNKFPFPTRVTEDTNWADVCFGYFTVLAIKSDGTLWVWGRNAGQYTGVENAKATLTPAQVGTDTNWQSCSSGEWSYQLLKKKDGSLWSMETDDHWNFRGPLQFQPKLTRMNVPKDIVSYGAGGRNIGVTLTSSGEIWTWGRVVGTHPPVEWVEGEEDKQPKEVVLSKPWRLSNL